MNKQNEDGDYKNIIKLIDLAEKDQNLKKIIMRDSISVEMAEKIAVFIYGRLSKK